MKKSLGAVSFFLLIVHIATLSAIKSEYYHIETLGVPRSVRIVKLREKRETSTDVASKNDITTSSLPNTNSDGLESPVTAGYDEPTSTPDSLPILTEQAYHDYYNSTLYINKAEADEIWNSIKDAPHNALLSQSYRKAQSVELQFDFPFYGNYIRNVTVATGGFLYTGDFVHSWLAATQYVAPLMANFDTSLSQNAYVRLIDNATSFTALWENVPLQDKPNAGNFTFSATLHNNGDIVFTYFSIPFSIDDIQDVSHPVKVGLSDAYIKEKDSPYGRRRTIYEYHRVKLPSDQISNGTIIRLTALKTCLDYTDCESCMKQDTKFKCTWCSNINRCSTGQERRRPDWINQGCDSTQVTNLSLCPTLNDNSDENHNAELPHTSDSENGSNAINSNEKI